MHNNALLQQRRHCEAECPLPGEASILLYCTSSPPLAQQALEVRHRGHRRPLGCSHRSCLGLLQRCSIEEPCQVVGILRPRGRCGRRHSCPGSMQLLLHLHHLLDAQRRCQGVAALRTSHARHVRPWVCTSDGRGATAAKCHGALQSRKQRRVEAPLLLLRPLLLLLLLRSLHNCRHVDLARLLLLHALLHLLLKHLLLLLLLHQVCRETSRLPLALCHARPHTLHLHCLQHVRRPLLLLLLLRVRVLWLLHLLLQCLQVKALLAVHQQLLQLLHALLRLLLLTRLRRLLCPRRRQQLLNRLGRQRCRPLTGLTTSPRHRLRHPRPDLLRPPCLTVRLLGLGGLGADAQVLKDAVEVVICQRRTGGRVHVTTRPSRPALTCRAIELAKEGAETSLLPLLLLLLALLLPSLLQQGHDCMACLLLLLRGQWLRLLLLLHVLPWQASALLLLLVQHRTRRRRPSVGASRCRVAQLLKQRRCCCCLGRGWRSVLLAWCCSGCLWKCTSRSPST